MIENMNNTANVAMYKAFSDLNWDGISASELVSHMQQAINEDPLLKNPDLISVTLEGSPRDRVFTLIGKVSDENEKKRAEEIVKNNAKEHASVKNELVID